MIDRTPVMYCIGTNYVRCHTCPALFAPPKPKGGYNDITGECPACKKKYIFWCPKER